MLIIYAEKQIWQNRLTAVPRLAIHIISSFRNQGAAVHTILEILGFTNLIGVIWNMLAYAAFICIIVGVSSDRYRNFLITLGGGLLAFYAYFFFHNYLFAVLQCLIVISGVLQWKKAKGAAMVMVVLTAAAYLFLIRIGAIGNIWALIGSFGLLGIVFGLVVLPKRYGFMLMAVGGALLVIYAFPTRAWVFFFLNIFFFWKSVQAWRKQ